MSTTEFYFFVLVAFGVISTLLGGVLTAGHRLHDSATGRRRVLAAGAIKGFSRVTSRRLLIFGLLLVVVGMGGVAVTR